MQANTPDGKVFDNGKPIVAVDIDNTLADYHGYFLQFAEKYLDKKMPSKSEINPGLRLSEFMGIDHETYRQVKLAYRQGGLKRSMPAFPQAKQMCQAIIETGAELWICTTRPYLRLDNIDPDTREWLQRNEIPYTAMVFGDSKYEDLAEVVGADRIVAVIEDLPEMAERAFSVGIKNVIMPRRPYNEKRDVKVRWLENGEAERLYRPWSLAQATTSVLEVLEEYFDKQKPAIDFSHRIEYAKDDGVDYEADAENALEDKETPYAETLPTQVPFNRLGALDVPSDQYSIDREERWLDIADQALAMFIDKSRDYGKTGDSLGARGQFADMWRKFGKLREQVWENPDRTPSYEGPREILMDVIGHAILFIDYLDKEQDQ